MIKGYLSRAGARGTAGRRLPMLGMLAALVWTLAPAAPASAANVWDCGADAVKVTVAGKSPLNPITTDKSPCEDSADGLPNTTDALGLAPGINARTAFAVTEVTPDGARPLDTTNVAAAGVEGLSIETSGGTIVIGADAVRSFARARCVNGAPELTGGGTAVTLTLNGQPIPLDTLLEDVTDAVSGSPLGALVQVKLNEQIKTDTALVQRGARITVLPAVGSAPLLEVIIAESRVSTAGLPCDPNVPENGDGVSGTNLSEACPAGTVFDGPSGFCVITAADSAGQGIVVVGRPFQTTEGGTVISLDLAKKRYGKNSICLTGKGPKFVTVGTKGNDRITGSNGPDRILGLSGNDTIDGGRGNDCLDGNNDRDNLNGAIGNDRVYGKLGNDALNGGPGKDHLSSGRGSDTINAAYGADRVLGGSGNDAINVATAGPAARVNCGPGRDKVRLNPEEVRRAKNCEAVRMVKRRDER